MSDIQQNIVNSEISTENFDGFLSPEANLEKLGSTHPYNPQKAKDETTRNLAFVVLTMLGIFMIANIWILSYIYFNLPSSSFEEKILNILENILVASLSILSGLASTVVTFYFVSRDKQQ